MKKTLMLSSETLKFLDARLMDNNLILLSSMINSVFKHFAVLLKESLPELTLEENLLLLNTYGSVEYSDLCPPFDIKNDVLGFLEIAQPENIGNYQSILCKFEEMSQIEQLAVIDFVCKTMVYMNKNNAKDSDDFEDYEQIFSKIKLL